MSDESRRPQADDLPSGLHALIEPLLWPQADREESERRRNAAIELLKQFSQASSRKEYLAAVVELIRGWIGCRCVGVRVLNARGDIPYEAYLGFSREFWEQECWISVRRDECACPRVVRGEPEPVDTYFSSVMPPTASRLNTSDFSSDTPPMSSCT